MSSLPFGITLPALPDILAVLGGVSCGLILWLLVAYISRRLGLNTIVAGGIGTAGIVAGVWMLSWLMSAHPPSYHIEQLLEWFAIWIMVGYLIIPIRLVAGSMRGARREEQQQLSFRDYCGLLTLAFVLGLIIFGGIGIPASVQRYGIIGISTLFALVAGMGGGIAASRWFDRQKTIPFPDNRFVYARSPLPFMGVWSLCLLFGTAWTTWKYY